MAWVAPVMSMLSGVQDMMSAITFIQFIEEEAIQSAALGTFLALRARSPRAASLGISRCRIIVEHLRVINNGIGVAAPYSRGCFADFILATETNLEIYDELLLRLAVEGK